MKSVPPTKPRQIILLMGVAGSGKTTIGRLLAAELGREYFEADEFHPPANVAKMARGEALDDADRAPWLAAIRARMDRCRAEGVAAVFSCSALKAAYRRMLTEGADGVAVVYLRGDRATIEARVAQRRGHYMKAGLVRSQFEALEEPDDALTIDVGAEPAEIVARIRRELGV